MRASLAALVALLAATAGAQTPTAAPDRFIGAWQGTLTAGAVRLRLGLEIARDSVGGLRGALTSIDQGNQKVAATVAVRGDTLVATAVPMQVRFVGVITAAGDTLRGTFTQGGSLPLVMGRVATLATVRRPQEPKGPFPYRSEEVAFESVPGVRLAGTLATPDGPGPFPAVVFATGSGAQDRDESLLGHRPFLVLADYLARHGIASLRVDDRGVAKSTGTFATATTADFANDVEAGVRFLRAQIRIARDRVGIIGHSEGGVIGPMVAARSPDVAFLVLLAGPGVAGDSILMLQGRALLVGGEIDSATIDRTMRSNRRVYDVLKSSSDSATVVARVEALARDYVATLPPAEQEKQPAAALARNALGANTPWMRYFLAYDPAPALRQVKVPVLALNGTLDLQVPYRENLAAIEAALQAGGNRDFRTVALPNLNHLFQTATTGMPAEYVTIEETMSPSVLELVTGWITEHAPRRP